jgi:hypothetical protein
VILEGFQQCCAVLGFFKDWLKKSKSKNHGVSKKSKSKNQAVPGISKLSKGCQFFPPFF